MSPLYTLTSPCIVGEAYESDDSFAVRRRRKGKARATFKDKTEADMDDAMGDLPGLVDDPWDLFSDEDGGGLAGVKDNDEDIDDVEDNSDQAQDMFDAMVRLCCSVLVVSACSLL